MAGEKRDSYNPVAEQVYFDPDNCDAIDSENVQDAIDELCDAATVSASPGIAYGRDGNVSGSTSNPGYLINNQVFSNKVGVPFGLNNGKLVEVWVGVQDPTDVDIRFYYHDGDEINLVTLATVSVVIADGRSKTFDETDLGTVNLPKGKQIACAVVDGNGKNIKVFVIATGSRGA